MDKGRLTPLSIPLSHLYPRQTDSLRGFDPAQRLLEIWSKETVRTKPSLDSHLLAPFMMSLSVFVQEKVQKDKIRHSLAIEGLLKLSKATTSKIKQSALVPHSNRRIFYPKNTLSDSPHSFKNGYNTGSFQVFCTTSRGHISLTSFEKGQYPWGRNQFTGAMAFLCSHLGITSAAQNTCLPTHIIIGLIYFKIITIEEIIAKHSLFVKNMLSSQHMREDIPTTNALLKN